MPDRHRVSYRAAARGGLIWLSLALAVGLFLGAENLIAKSFAACISQESAKEANKRSNNYPEIIAVSVETQALCSLRLIDRHNGFFAALAGFIVAAFTFTLWRSSDRLWDAGREALETTERAYVFLDGFAPEITTAEDVHEARNHLPERYRDDPGLFMTRFAVRPRWKNGGNTPTKRMTVQVGWRGPEGPIPPVYSYSEPPKTLFLAPKAVETGTPIEMNAAQVLIDWALNPLGVEPQVFIWGRADYEDVFDRKHFVEWCYVPRFERHDAQRLRVSFIQWGDYNRTDETDDSRQGAG